MFFRKSHGLILLSVVFATTACFVEVKEANDRPKDLWSDNYIQTDMFAHECPNDSYLSSYYSYRTASYSSDSSEHYRFCYEKNDTLWRTTCEQKSCDTVKVFVHYMIGEDFHESHTVYVEAFDNPNFNGYPAANTRISRFQAARGESKDVDLFLSPGTYYLRAFLTNKDEQVTPSTFEGMEVVADKPFGVYGVLSDASQVTVSPDKSNEPIHIFLDQLFEEEGSKPETNARLKIRLETEKTDLISLGRKIRISLHKYENFMDLPVEIFTIPSDSLLIQGRLGRTEYVTPSLPAGNYYVQVYLDENDNEFFDSDELGAIHQKDDLPKLISVRRNRILPLTFTF